jgi:hypothetical protein
MACAHSPFRIYHDLTPLSGDIVIEGGIIHPRLIVILLFELLLLVAI